MSYKNLSKLENLFRMQISNYLLDVMESNETDAQAVDYMRSMYKGCMDEGK